MVESLIHTTDFDLVIIGGGYLGAWSAYFAAKLQPEWKVLIVDKSAFASGASLYGADLDFANNATEEKLRLSNLSRALFEQVKTEIPEFPIHEIEAFAIGTKDQVHSNSLEKFNGARILKNKKTFQVSGNRFEIQADQLVCGPLRAFRANNKNLIKKLFQAVKESTVDLRFLEHCEVKKVSFQDGKNNILLEDGKVIHTHFVISAVGPWSLQIPWKTNFDLDWRVKKIIAFDLLTPPQENAELLYLLDDDAFLMPMPEEKKWLLSTSSQEWDCQPNEQLEITAAELEQAKKLLEKYAPQLVQYLEKGRVFCDSYSTHKFPAVLFAKETNTQVLLGGCSGSGFRLAPSIAKEAIEKLIYSYQEN